MQETSKINISDQTIFSRESLRTESAVFDTTENNDNSKKFTYEAFDIIGKGSFGIVFKALHKEQNEIVAVKRVFQDKKLNQRELELLGQLNHPNIIQLKNAFYIQKSSENNNEPDIYLNIVMEYVPKNLLQIIEENNLRRRKISAFELQIYSYQILKAAGYLHNKNICHRDIKPENILISEETKIIKLCDFGSAKIINSNETNISYICSRYYRAPELILGANQYTFSVDIWSIGCLIAEMLCQKVLFQGKDSLDQLVSIIKVLGSPTQEQVLKMNPNFVGDLILPKIRQMRWTLALKTSSLISHQIADLLSKMLVYDPSKRLSAYEALSHPIFDIFRQKETYEKYSNLPNLLDFSQGLKNILLQFQNYVKLDELLSQQDIYNKLVPSWYKIQSIPK